VAVILVVRAFAVVLRGSQNAAAGDMAPGFSGKFILSSISLRDGEGRPTQFAFHFPPFVLVDFGAVEHCKPH
jgi:hypothetical protein